MLLELVLELLIIVTTLITALNIICENKKVKRVCLVIAFILLLIILVIIGVK